MFSSAPLAMVDRYGKGGKVLQGGSPPPVLHVLHTYIHIRTPFIFAEFTVSTHPRHIASMLGFYSIHFLNDRSVYATAVAPPMHGVEGYVGM